MRPQFGSLAKVAEVEEVCKGVAAPARDILLPFPGVGALGLVPLVLQRILRLAGIDDKPSYTRNQLINKQEETQSIVLQAQFFDEEYIQKKLLTINGDIDQFDEIAKRMDADELTRLSEPEEEPAPEE